MGRGAAYPGWEIDQGIENDESGEWKLAEDPPGFCRTCRTELLPDQDHVADKLCADCCEVGKRDCLWPMCAKRHGGPDLRWNANPDAYNGGE